MGTATATVRIPISAASYAAAIEGLTRINERLLAGNVGAQVPALYASGVRYKREPRDVWRHVGDVLQSGWGDCEDLAAWRAAELRVSGVDPMAHVAVYQSGPRRYHAIVARGNGTTEDPSRKLGMKRGAPFGTLEGDDMSENTDDEEQPDEPEVFDDGETPPESFDEEWPPAPAWPETRPMPDEGPPPARPDPIPHADERRVVPLFTPAAAPAAAPAARALPAAPRIVAKPKPKPKPKAKKKIAAKKKAAARKARRRKAAAMAGYCAAHMRREPIGTEGAWFGMGDDPMGADASPQVTFDLYKSGQGWSGIVRIPLAAMRGQTPQAMVVKTSPTKPVSSTPGANRSAKKTAAKKTLNLAAKISTMPGVRALVPPPAAAALQVLKSPIGKPVSKVARKLLTKLF